MHLAREALALSFKMYRWIYARPTTLLPLTAVYEKASAIGMLAHSKAWYRGSRSDPLPDLQLAQGRC